MIKINYKQRYQYSYLVFAIIWTILGITAIFINASGIFAYGYPGLAIFYLVAFGYRQKYQVGKIEEGIVTIYGFKKKEIHLSKITEIKNLRGDLILISPDKKIELSKRIIDNTSLDILLNTEPIKTLKSIN